MCMWNVSMYVYLMYACMSVCVSYVRNACNACAHICVHVPELT